MADYLKIKDLKVETILAISNDEQERGLMGVPFPPPIMSFVYASPRINKFWMHRTPSPLDIVFVLNNKITSICSGEPYSTRIIGDENPSDLVVELPAGTCKTSGISVGDEIILECCDASKMKIFMLKNGINYR
jgi:uncharacterized membrane protein (UPF0127 family)